jgi:hypothetical protein
MKRHPLFVPALVSMGLAASLGIGCGQRLTGPSGTSGYDETVDRRALIVRPADPNQSLIAAIRDATARFHNIDAAFAAGYVDDGYGCIDSASFGLDPALGGMGFHLINDALHADPETDPLRPDLLVYEPSASGKPNLVALEYEVFRDDWANAGHTAPPTLLGHEFESIDFDTIHVYGLHIWLWRDNPNGFFEDFNPKTSCH